MSLNNLLPATDERMLIVGASGSGKTTLAKCLLAIHPAKRILIIDPKNTYGGPTGAEGYRVFRSPGELRWIGRKERKLQYRPGANHNFADYDAIYKWAYYQGGELLVYTDEIFATMKGNRSPDWQRACITQGRELGISMISATQRPRGIDPRLMTESEVKAVFLLRNRADRGYLAEEMGEELMAKPPEYAFWYLRDGMQHPRLCRISLKGGE